MIQKSIVSILTLFMLFTTVCQISAEEVLIDKQLLEKILERQDALEEEVRQLKDQIKKRAIPAVTSPYEQEVEYLKEDVEDMSGRLDTVEKKSILDKIRLNADFRVRMDYIDHNNFLDDNGQEKDGRTDELWSSRLRIYLRSEVTDNIIFHGRLNYFKLWGDTNYDPPQGGVTYDLAHSAFSDREGNLHVERAYIDYFVPDTPFSLSFGRIPLGEGPPVELKNYTSRKGTWPKIVNDLEGDGISANISLDNWTGLKNAMFRIMYVKLFQNYLKYDGIEMNDWRAIVSAFETEIPGVKDSLLWLSHTRLEDIPNIFGMSPPEDLGKVDSYVAHLQFRNLMDGNLDYFAAFNYTHTRPVSEGVELAPGYEVGLYGDTLHDDLGKSRNGYCIYTGLRYKLPLSILKYPRLGFEYNHGSKYFMAAPPNDGEMIDKIGVTGDVYELYYIQPIHEKMFCRLGAIYAGYDSYNHLMGVFSHRPESDMSMFNTYFLINVRF